MEEGMTQEQARYTSVRENFGFNIPPAEASRREARRRLALTLARDELVWVLQEHYNPQQTLWHIDVMRSGAGGRWVRQRYRYDAQAEILYFLGESALSDEQFQKARSSATIFPIAELQDQPE
jgi:hypothetical protein